MDDVLARIERVYAMLVIVLILVVMDDVLALLYVRQLQRNI